MNYMNTELTRNEVINLIKGHTTNDFDFEVCDGKIPNYKENYFRIYVDGNRSEFFEMYFVSGELCSFGYSRTVYSINREDRECGNYKVVTKLPPSVKKFMQHLVNSMADEDYPYEMTDNAKRFLNFIVKIVKSA